MQGSSLLTNKDDQGSSVAADEKITPLNAFIVAESSLAIRLVRIIHQSLLTINRSLKANAPLGLSLTETALEIATMKVKTTPK